MVLPRHEGHHPRPLQENAARSLSRHLGSVHWAWPAGRVTAPRNRSSHKPSTHAARGRVTVHRAWEHEVQKPGLPDVPQALERSGIDNRRLQGVQGDVTLDRISNGADPAPRGCRLLGPSGGSTRVRSSDFLPPAHSVTVYHMFSARPRSDSRRLDRGRGRTLHETSFKAIDGRPCARERRSRTSTRAVHRCSVG